MEKTKLFEVRTEGDGLFTFHLMVTGKLKAKQW
ncbi:hypothetical protein AMTRI_Chr10g2910 [Amborella trichopoda]